MLHLELGDRERCETGLSFIRRMVRRGLRNPVLVTTDGAPGLIRAAEEVWGKSLCQHCLPHTPTLAGGAREMRNSWTRCRALRARRSSAACGTSSIHWS
jgi:transposase-like protein